jgi:23S rRNA (uracil1939-C5)-methyltransferase
MPEALVTIEKLVHGGDGLARLPDGQVVFVSGVLPGEEVRIEVFQRLGDYALAHPVEIVKPSPDRKDPPCPYFPECGGCQWQHIAYRAQTDLKLSIFRETLARLGDIDPDLIEGIVPSPRPLGYRHRLQFHVHQETGALGFLKRRSHDLVPLRSCALATPEINQVLATLPDLPAWKFYAIIQFNRFRQNID